MRILIDAVLFQLGSAGSDDMRLCARVLAEMARIAATRDIHLTVLDRGALPELGGIEACRFPSYKAENSVADGEMLERMSRLIGADVFVSTSLTMVPSLPNVQLLFGEGGEALLPGRSGPGDLAECEIALAFSAAVVSASPATEDAFRSRFPRRHLQGTCDIGASDIPRALRMAVSAIDAAAASVSAIDDSDRRDRFLALRRMQAGFELSDGPSPHPRA